MRVSDYLNFLAEFTFFSCLLHHHHRRRRRHLQMRERKKELRRKHIKTHKRTTSVGQDKKKKKRIERNRVYRTVSDDMLQNNITHEIYLFIYLFI